VSEQLPLQWDEPAAGVSPTGGRTPTRRRADEWRIDPRTRRVGLQGLAQARAALAAAGGGDRRGADAA